MRKLIFIIFIINCVSCVDRYKSLEKVYTVENKKLYIKYEIQFVNNTDDTQYILWEESFFLTYIEKLTGDKQEYYESFKKKGINIKERYLTESYLFIGTDFPYWDAYLSDSIELSAGSTIIFDYNGLLDISWFRDKPAYFFNKNKFIAAYSKVKNPWSVFQQNYIDYLEENARENIGLVEYKNETVTIRFEIE